MDVPIGTVVAFAGMTQNIPTGWLDCDGRKASPGDRVNMVELFAALGTLWGGTGHDDFNLPDLQGMFLRGMSDKSGRDPDTGRRRPAGTGTPEEVGSFQEHKFAQHTHAVHDPGHSHSSFFGSTITAGQSVFERANETKPGGPTSQPNVTGLTVQGCTNEELAGPETRPINAYVRWIIRVR